MRINSFDSFIHSNIQEEKLSHAILHLITIFADKTFAYYYTPCILAQWSLERLFTLSIIYLKDFAFSISEAQKTHTIHCNPVFKTRCQFFNTARVYSNCIPRAVMSVTSKLYSFIDAIRKCSYVSEGCSRNRSVSSVSFNKWGFEIQSMSVFRWSTIGLNTMYNYYHQLYSVLNVQIMFFKLKDLLKSFLYKTSWNGYYILLLIGYLKFRIRNRWKEKHQLKTSDALGNTHRNVKTLII